MGKDSVRLEFGKFREICQHYDGWLFIYKEALRALLPGPWAEANKKLREQTQVPPAPKAA